MFYSLLLVLILFCAVVGIGLGSNNNGIGAVIICSFAAWLSMQLAYLVAQFWRH